MAGDDDPTGAINVNDAGWHHYAAVDDGLLGIRKLYVGGVVDSGVDLMGDFGPTGAASWEFLVSGGRDANGVVGAFTPCLLNDVRICRVPLR